MPLPLLNINKNWFTATTVQEGNWDNIRTPLLDWASKVNLAFQQITLDTFGSYNINNTGAPTLSQNLRDQINAIVGGSALITGTSNATFTIHQGSAGNAILSTTGLTGARTFTFPDASDVLLGRDAVQTITNKTLNSPILTTPTIASFVNATHDHQSAAGGGPLVAAAIPNLDTSKITTGTFADARIAASNVTQHQASLAIAASQITSGTFSDSRIAASNVTQHQGALAINSSQITFSEILLPAIDPPTANYANRNSFLSSWGKVSNSGGSLLNYNVSSVVRTSTGHYTITVDVGSPDLALATVDDYGFCVDTDCIANQIFVRTSDSNTRGPADCGFTFMAIGF